MVRPIAVAVMMWLCHAAAGAPLHAAGPDVCWPGWRGPGRDGWVRGLRPPNPWPERLARVWQIEVGSGYSSPVVSGDCVWQHARQGEDEVVWCLNLETGAVKWRQAYAAPFTVGQGGERHGKGPKSSPALAGGRLFTMSITGVLSGWDADSGKLLWRRDESARFEKGHPYWGASTSPLVDGGRVIVHFGGDEGGALMALDAESGKEVWSHEGDGPSYASPILVEIQAVRQIVGLTAKRLVGVDAESGRLLWDYPYAQGGSVQNMVTPVYHRGLVLLGGENRGIRGLRPERSKGAWTVGQQWHQKAVALNMSSAVLNSDFLYGFSQYGQGRLFCLDPATGEVRWEGPGRSGDNAMLLAMAGHVAVLLDHGQLRIIAASPDRLNTVASYPVSDQPTWSPPVLLKTGVLIKDRQTLALWSLGG